jgi:uncharacterized protein
MIKSEMPAYREPWFWFVLAPLIVVVILSFVFMYFAVMGADDRVADDYYKQGRLINHHFAAQQRAQDLQIQAEATFDTDTTEVLVTLTGKQMPGELNLHLSHPAEANRDAVVVLKRVADNSYRAELPQIFQGRWYLTLSAGADEQKWSISAEVNFAQSANVSFVPHL